MNPSACTAHSADSDAAAARSQLDVTIVARPEHSKLRAQRPEVLRVKVLRSAGATTTVLAGWSDPDSWSTVNWGSTIAAITRLLADDLALDANIEAPAVSLAGLHLHPEDQDHPEPGIELLFDPRPVASLEVVVDRVTPDADTFLWLFGSLRAATAYAALQEQVAS